MRSIIFTLLLSGSLAQAAPFDRNQSPEPLEARAFQPPEIHTGSLSNGISVTLVENHEVPLVWVRMVFDRGGWTDPADQAGLMSTTADMLNEGAGDLDAASLSTAARSLATHLNTWSSSDVTGVSIRSLKKNLAESLDLMALVILKPTFPEADWALMRKKRLADLVSAKNNPRSMHRRQVARQFYGGQYRGNLSTAESLQQITTNDMRTAWTQHLTASNARIFVGGDTNLDTVLPLLEARLGAWKGSPTEATEPSVFPPNPDSPRIVLIDKPGAPQSVVGVGSRALRRTEPDYMAAHLANMAFGGFFSARLNLNLREEKGWTYGARSSFSHNRLPEVFSAGASVKTDTTADAIAEILKELRESQDDRPFSEDELTAVRGYLLGTYPVRFENPNYLLEQLEDVWIYDLPKGWVSGYSERVRQVNLIDIQKAWRRWIDPNQVTIIVVGDATAIRPGLDALNLPITVVDADGQTVGE
jgi:zinc protease